MDDLVRLLVIGLVVAAVLVPVVRWFWKRFDRPTEAQLEYEESKRKKREEERMWRQIEARMRAEEATAEEAASLARKRAKLAAQAAPRAANVEAALGALGLETEPVKTTDARPPTHPKATAGAEEALVNEAVFEEVADDEDLDVEGPAKVSLEQDRAGAPAPDWELIERLRDMNERQEQPAPVDVPSMPDLDALDDALEAVEEDVIAPAARAAEDLSEAADEGWVAKVVEADEGWDVEW